MASTTVTIEVQANNPGFVVERELELPFTLRLPSGRRCQVTEAHMDGSVIVVDAGKMIP
jgi:hypothetical protein